MFTASPVLLCQTSHGRYARKQTPHPRTAAKTPEPNYTGLKLARMGLDPADVSVGRTGGWPDDGFRMFHAACFTRPGRPDAAREP
jgi:hypothetical protein